MQDDFIMPVFKWGGGKRQLLKYLLPKVPSYSCYYEPFFGGGALFFALKPQKAVIGDLNNELMNTYRVIREKPVELIKELEYHNRHNSTDYYYQVRAWDRDEDYNKRNDVERAARTLYLNRTCFNGLYRVNKSGYFNTPCGKYTNREIVNGDIILQMHSYLKANQIKIVSGDYIGSLKGIRKGAFVYFDPPYMPPEYGAESFTKYTTRGFGESEQIKLKDMCDELSRRNVKFMLSNSDCDFMNELFQDYYVEKVQARRSVSADGRKRTLIDEIIVTNYKV